MRNEDTDAGAASAPAHGSADTYAAYSDEARHNVGRVRGVGAVSVRASAAGALGAEVAAILAESGVAECKWELARSARYAFAAGKLLAWALDRALAGTVWIDVLTWSPEDTVTRREGVPALARLHRMYALLLDGVVMHPGPAEAVWSIYPDEQGALRWERIVARMSGGGRIARVSPVRSHEEPLVQVADLLVGLGVFSREAYGDYERWHGFPDDERNVAEGRFAVPERFPASLRYRCKLLDDFYTGCLRRLPVGARVSLRANRGLRTYTREAPIRFRWHPEEARSGGG
jgi:hypothetical protein